jgi:ionotropic glutamate receptor
MYGKGNTSHFLSAQDGVNLVRDGGYAFHIEFARAYPIIEYTFSDEAICELQELKLFKNTDLYTGYQKGSSFRNMLETWYSLSQIKIVFTKK